MAMFNYFKTGDPIYDTIISTVVISVVGYIINYVYDNNIDQIFMKISLDDIKSLFYKKNILVLEGKRSTVVSAFSYSPNVTALYSNRFKALLDYIISNMDTINGIYSIKEAHSNYQSSSLDGDKRKNMDIFMVYQNKHFKISDNIFVKTEISQDDSTNKEDKINTKTDKITIHIYSYVYSVNYLKKYVDEITEKYLMSIKENRSNRKFIYFLDKVKTTEEDESRLNCWREDIFESARTFNNIFFDGKKELLTKIDYFLQNRNWYYEKGIPYSMGIGLHGPPGTGKTSFIKALANYTNRHIIVMSFKTIKTKGQLEQFFFENRYNDKNEVNSISFDKKIIVFEDVDCIGDIILDRNHKKQPENNIRTDVNQTLNKTLTHVLSEGINTSITSSEINTLGNVIQGISDLNEFKSVKIPSLEDPITLDDILNLWDGIRETPGRILVISSNHYNTLDPALIRPGRIDITHELSNASHNTIAEIYFHLFGTKIDKNILKQVKEYFYSPAELINIYVSYKNKGDFIKRLLKNERI
jgi:SpoVK/Ycf46/Vps4 family AAA+-type ATPase